MKGKAVHWLAWAALGGAIVATGLAAVLLRRQPAAPEPPRIAEVGSFELVDHAGRRVTEETLAGELWIVDFIFTRCRSSCPLMTEAMRRLRADCPPDLAVRFVSISVDPEHDRPAVLAGYRREHGIEGEDWLFLTGEREAVHRLVSKTFLLQLDPDPPPELVTPEMPILHSTRFVLVDRRGSIRGYYDGLDRGDLERLQRDARTLVEPG
jgi:cytochrome oxidase Cu insertion factor (SCO1/SenC/PrrC family)